jgi:hypothetical protein
MDKIKGEDEIESIKEIIKGQCMYKDKFEFLKIKGVCDYTKEEDA